ncbi:hypothetical protein Sru01_28100 [Sphaerisporangium rufum]|uniref:Radical SAM core domain-containing protein n=1 Tax=Sphaerisporangium rufum TaxID=1381558 RepID=A0A919R2G2_9ACTN|nr:radical SAM protein [Sphaerisporangium rufum]GII77828.1 hypothetical protein Sru01_28100 [Sphaerisporangium rufum]
MPRGTPRDSLTPLTLANLDRVRVEEVFRLGALRDGVRFATTAIRLPLLGQVLPRVELVISGPDFQKKITVRVNQSSPFVFDGARLRASLNGAEREVACEQFVDDDRAPTGMYNFGLLRENGTRSFVFDYHTYCAYSCDFCFKESEWEVLAVQGTRTGTYQANFDKCLEYVRDHATDFHTKYDIVWLCTGSITNEDLELDRHRRMARALREAGYREGVYVSQVIPPSLIGDHARRIEYLTALRESGVSRFNSGIEVVRPDYRRRLIHGYKSGITFEDYVDVFTDAVEVFGVHNVGSCLLAGIEPAEDTLRGLRTIAELGVVPSPTVFTAFVVKQQQIPFVYDLDGLIDVHVRFNEIIDEFKLPVFSGVFSLA